jgi:hypothetical protein
MDMGIHAGEYRGVPLPVENIGISVLTIFDVAFVRDLRLFDRERKGKKSLASCRQEL